MMLKGFPSALQPKRLWYQQKSHFWMSKNETGKARLMPRCCVVALDRTILPKMQLSFSSFLGIAKHDSNTLWEEY